MKKNRGYLAVSVSVWLALHASLLAERSGTVVSAMKKDRTGGKIRGLADTVGYAHTQEQMDAVIHLCDSLESVKSEEESSGFDLQLSQPWVAGICPHDDYIYAAHVYADIMRNIRAGHVILFGVAHQARTYNLKDKLIFDAHDMWQGPYGNVRVSPLREDIIERLPVQSYTIHDELHRIEHSVEGLIPFLQYYIRDVQIVPVLVPYMSWEKLDRLTRELSEAFSEIITEKDLILGQDLAFLCSNDCVHYGDQGWGGKNYAPFGADVSGYERAVQRDQDLIEHHLVGELTSEKLQNFFVKLVDQEDVTQYKITWCGRFSVPFGLHCLQSLVDGMARRPVNGYLLKYDTSVAAGELPIRELGLGSTAPSNLRHWVGYCAIGYR